jgi:hypothetical protein
VVVADPALDARGHTAVDLMVTTTDGRVLQRALDIAPGFPGAELTDTQHRARLDDCIAYAPHGLPPAQVLALLDAIESVAALDDARVLAALLVAPTARREAGPAPNVPLAACPSSDRSKATGSR